MLQVVRLSCAVVPATLDVVDLGCCVLGLGWVVVARQNWHTSATGVTAVTLDTDASQEVVIGWQ